MSATPKPKRVNRFSMHDEFLNLDFPTVSQLHGNQEHLADLIICYKDLATARRLPAPSVSWLNVVMRVENIFRLDGDEESLFHAIMRGKMLLLYRYSMDLRQTLSCYVLYSPFPMSYPVLHSPMDAALRLNGFTGTQTVDEYAVEYAQSSDSLLEDVTTILRPFAQTIHNCIPSTVFNAAAMPYSRAEFLAPYIVEYITQAAGYAPKQRPYYLACIRLALSKADGGPGRDLDVGLPLDILALPCVPSWDFNQITILLKLEMYTWMNMEQDLLKDSNALSGLQQAFRSSPGMKSGASHLREAAEHPTLSVPTRAAQHYGSATPPRSRPLSGR
ncbi:hypothetical protein DFH09DRAFT_1111980 [Mycena vulgaris]|nr:hypothetical protein DFH09DRAFT_1111980 [Mycena vulgaris]